MAYTLGTDSVIRVGAAGQTTPSGTFVDIGLILSGSLNISHNSVDTTNNDDAGYTSFLPGNTTITLSCECRYDPTNAGIQDIRDVAADFGNGSFKGEVAFEVLPFGDVDGFEGYSFDAYVTSFEVNVAENDTALNLSFEATATGPAMSTTPTFTSDVVP